MIIVDFSQVFMSNIFMHMKTEKDFSIDLLRHMVLNSIRGYKTKFGNEYGDIVFAIDNKKCWRKQVFQHYKAKRVDDKEKSTVDWDLIYKNLDIIVDEFIEYLPYKVLKIDECEGDDIIAVLTQKFSSSEKILIISTDDDFIQLQKYGNVKQYSPTKKVYINSNQPLIDLKTKILRGDKGDGVPNVLSLDNSFVDGIRQKNLSEEKVNLWVRQEISVFCNTNELQRNYARNKMLIDFDEIPNYIRNRIVDAYETTAKNPRSKLMKYFMQHRMKNLLSIINEI